MCGLLAPESTGSLGKVWADAPHMWSHRYVQLPLLLAPQHLLCDAYSQWPRCRPTLGGARGSRTQNTGPFTRLCLLPGDPLSLANFSSCKQDQTFWELVPGFSGSSWVSSCLALA